MPRNRDAILTPPAIAPATAKDTTTPTSRDPTRTGGGAGAARSDPMTTSPSASNLARNQADDGQLTPALAAAAAGYDYLFVGDRRVSIAPLPDGTWGGGGDERGPDALPLYALLRRWVRGYPDKARKRERDLSGAREAAAAATKGKKRKAAGEEVEGGGRGVVVLPPLPPPPSPDLLPPLRGFEPDDEKPSPPSPERLLASHKARWKAQRSSIALRRRVAFGIRHSERLAAMAAAVSSPER